MRREAPDRSARFPHGPGGPRAATSPTPPHGEREAGGERVSVALLCRCGLIHDYFAGVIRSQPDLRLAPPHSTDQPDVVLWVAESGAGIQALQTGGVPDPWRRAVLLDIADRLGPVAAGLHGFLGYLPANVSEGRLLIALRRVATGQPDAPVRHLLPLVRTLATPPLSDLDRQILRLQALGRSHQQITQETAISERTLQRHITHLLARWNGSDGHHLGAIAVALGLGWPWEGEGPLPTELGPD